MAGVVLLCAIQSACQSTLLSGCILPRTILTSAWVSGGE